ncbi:MAG: hypothetical protein AAF108_02135 [Planctomycetota bacterium]
MTAPSPTKPSTTKLKKTSVGEAPPGARKREKVGRAARRARSPLALLAITGAFMWVASCTAVVEPGQPLELTKVEVAALRGEMEASPADLERPVVVLSGYHAWPSMADRLADRLAAVTSGDRDDFVDVAYTNVGEFDKMVSRAILTVDAAFPSDDPRETVEVDVVGISAGGLVARAAAMPLHKGLARDKRLKIRRLYTLGTPHRGALLAERIAPDPAAKDMVQGSDFLRSLDEDLPGIDYEIYPYAHLNDTWVGATRSAPPGYDPVWTGGRRMFSHFGVSDNKMFILDIARRLRGDEPLASEPTPPPRD